MSPNVIFLSVRGFRPPLTKSECFLGNQLLYDEKYYSNYQVYQGTQQALLDGLFSF